jgi:NitT/TauT family transport system ATP-binding protein
MITVENVWKEYGAQVVLERVSLTIADRAFLALVGPSGCGKTTFLKLLLGEERPSQGSITLDGKPLAPEPGPDRGVVFQRYSVFPHLTVLGNVLLGKEFAASPVLARLFGAARRSAVEEARSLIAEVGLGGSEDKYPAQLSGGMQQRLALAQALIMRPRVLLLDEPFGALDPGIRAEIHVLMKRLWNETNLTVVMVTHDMREAFTLATRVIAFERPRSAPADRERYGATLGADISVWPPRIAGGHDPDAPDALDSLTDRPDRDDPIAPAASSRDDPALMPQGAKP